MNEADDREIQIPKEILAGKMIVIAPLAGISDFPFREMVRKFKPDLTFAEMVSVSALISNPSPQIRLLSIKEHEKPIGIQLLGNRPESFLRALTILERLSPAVIDLNFSCPVPKIVKKGSGAALLANPDKIREICSLMRKNTSIPISAKIRIGLDAASIVAVDIAKLLEDTGVNTLTVHGRTRDQLYSGPVHYDVVRKVKETVRIPVIGNGGIYSPADAMKFVYETGVDGIQLATGLFGRYWLTGEIRSGTEWTPPVSEKISLLKEHYKLMLDEYDERHALRQMRKHVVWMANRLPPLFRFRKAFLQCESSSGIWKLFDIIEKDFTSYDKGMDRDISGH